jgi:hypothetical protein
VKTLSAPVLTALASDAVAIVQLVELVFSSGTIRLNSSNWNLAYGGNTYTGAYGLGSVSPVTDQPGEVQGITLVLSGGDPLRIALALDRAHPHRRHQHDRLHRAGRPAGLGGQVRHHEHR